MKKNTHFYNIVIVSFAAIILSACGIKPADLKAPSSVEDPKKVDTFPEVYPKK